MRTGPWGRPTDKAKYTKATVNEQRVRSNQKPGSWKCGYQRVSRREEPIVLKVE